MMPVGRWHVYFGGEPVVMGHLCDLHRALGRTIPCPHAAEISGDCEHVQIRLCSCPQFVPCSACRDDFLGN